MPEFQDPNTRRQFLRVMGASIALAGVSGCVYTPPEKIVPYVKQPERIVPGKPLFFASAVPMNGYGTGVLVESNMGRPTKIEGNPDHPASLGATDVFMQASVLDLYDPDRSKVVTRNGRVSTYDDFLAVLVSLLDKHKADEGKGIRILTGTTTSPTLVEQIRGLLGQLPEAQAKASSPNQDLDTFPKARWITHEPTDSGAAAAGAKLAFDQPVEPIYHFENADVIVSLDADFLSWSPSRLVNARKFAERRETTAKMNRLYVVEPAPTITGAMADHRLAAKPSQIAAIAQAIGEAIAGDSKPRRRLGRPRGRGPQGPSRQQPRAGRQHPAGRGSCPCPRAERDARQPRQDGRIRRAGRRQSDRRGDFARRVGQGYRRRAGLDARDPRRQPGL